LSEAERKLGNPVASRAALDRALECDPSLGRARYNRALLARDLGDASAARKDLEQIVAAPLATPPAAWQVDACFELARLLLAAGETSAAEGMYGRYRGLGGGKALR
jgi:tetratricopeptide (TPR) repeat protein